MRRGSAKSQGPWRAAMQGGVSETVLFTDLGTDFPNEIPSFEVIWGVPSNGYPGMSAEVPFGLKIEVEVADCG